MSLFFLPEALGLSSSSLYFVNTCPGRCKASVSPLVLALVDWCLSSTHANVLLSFLLSFPAVQSHSPFLFKFLMKRSWYSWACTNVSLTLSCCFSSPGCQPGAGAKWPRSLVCSPLSPPPGGLLFVCGESCIWFLRTPRCLFGCYSLWNIWGNSNYSYFKVFCCLH